MASNYLTKGLKRSALTLALGLCFAGGVQAQSNAAGTVFGTAAPGSTVTIRNNDTGLTREIRIDNTGRYRVPQLPIGNYSVTLSRDGQTLAARESVQVLLGAGSEVSFAASDQTLETITVTSGSVSPVDVSVTDTRVVFTAEQLQKISVGNNIQAVTLLTPGVVQADSRYGNVQSFGGSAASENAFYINGYAVTNPLTNLGSTTLPFDGIAQLQSYIGGYGAEYGRATGGVVNIITKSGTNEWHAGGMVTWSPDGMRSTQKDIFYPNAGTASDGLMYQKLSDRTVDELRYGVYVSGPIIKDRLFIYASGEYTQQDVETVGTRAGAADTNFVEIDNRLPRWLMKMDWNITDNHLLELTAVSDRSRRDDDYFSYSYTSDTPYVRGYNKNGGYHYADGGELYIGKYTGYLTDNLTISALYGEQKQSHVADPFGYDPTKVAVSDTRPGSNPVTGQQPYGQLDFSDAYDETKGGRFDIDWALGSHTLRLGYDRQESTSRAGEETSGPGYRWIYYSVGEDAANDTIPGSGGAHGPGGNGDYVVKYIYANGGTFTVKQYAYYLEDRWQINDNWLLTLGVRNENFRNYNSDDIIYVQQKNQWAPRLGVSWDVNGDSSLKVFANAGRYHLAMPNNVALRGAAGSTYTTEFFSFTGIDPATGVPLGLNPLGNGPYSSNNEYGQAPDPATVAATSLKSHYQDEYVLGMEKTLTDDLVFGARFVYRDLKSAIDDTCDFRPAYYWALDNGYGEDDANAFAEALENCRLFNPSANNTFTFADANGNLQTLDISNDYFGFPKLKRTYQGVDLFLEHPFDGTFYYRVDYTWSKNYGNAEGQLKSDVGQTDVSQTMDWDHRELMENSNGYLPNDRRHYLKAYGFWQMSPEWRLSATMLANSGRPKNCFGIYNGPSIGLNDDEFREYVEYGGPYYFYCNGQPSPRGSAGRLPWETRLDLGVNYAPAFADNKLQFGLDVFNVTNSQKPQNMIEYGEIGAAGNPYAQSYRVISYSSPRYFRFTVRYDF